MGMKSVCCMLVLAAALAGVRTAPIVSAQSAEAWAGTWVLNVEKSTYRLGPAPASAISRLQPLEDYWRVTQDTVDAAQGTAVHVETMARFDGKDYPVSGLANATWAFTRIDDHTYELVTKRAGRLTATTRNVISADGSTRTSMTIGRNAQDQTLTNVAVYERR